MKNDNYVVMYCNTIVGTFNTLEVALKVIEDLKKDDFYLQKGEFSLYVKTSL